jgi:hypothetical protein
MGVTRKEIENAKPGCKPYKLRDGSGLRLLVSPTGQDSGVIASRVRRR